VTDLTPQKRPETAGHELDHEIEKELQTGWQSLNGSAAWPFSECNRPLTRSRVSRVFTHHDAL